MTGDPSEEDPRSLALERFREEVGAAVEAWCQGIGGRPLRDDGALCDRCVRSGALEVLGDFALLPHRPLHALVVALDDILEAEVGLAARARYAALTAEWLDDLDPGFPGGEPLDPDDYRALRRWYQTVRDEIAADVADLAALLRIEQLAVVAEVAERWALVGAALSRGWIADTVDVQEPRLLDASSAQIEEWIDTALLEWVLWLPEGRWRTAFGVPDGGRCELCSDPGPLFGIEGPHGALHPLHELLAAVCEQAATTPDRVDVEQDPLARTTEAERIATELVVARAGRIRRALATWVLPLVDDEVRAAGRWLPSIGENGLPPGPGAPIE